MVNLTVLRPAICWESGGNSIQAGTSWVKIVDARGGLLARWRGEAECQGLLQALARLRPESGSGELLATCGEHEFGCRKGCNYMKDGQGTITFFPDEAPLLDLRRWLRIVLGERPFPCEATTHLGLISLSSLPPFLRVTPDEARELSALLLLRCAEGGTLNGTYRFERCAFSLSQLRSGAIRLSYRDLRGQPRATSMSLTMLACMALCLAAAA